ncbi:MAG: redox-regulated ATPase YchF, partial [Oscillospiraceae bacterium]|nr:redox-regulated ATPase YchF [Oscillospiraceae bacterium]
MALSCGLVGLPSVGKTTFFDLLTGWGADARTRPSGKAGVSSGHARIPDGRVDYLSAMFKPKKTTYAQMEVTDVPWIKGGGPEFVAALGACDALAHIVRAFRGVGGADGEPDPMAELRELDAETLLSDIMSAEARMGRIRSGGKKKAESEGEEAALERCLTTLNEGKPLTEANMAEDDADALRHMRFLSGKPYVVVANLGEDGLRTGSWPQKALVEGYCAERGVTLLEVSAGLEEEIGRLPEGERAAFMEDLGLTESGVGRMARALYAQLRLA